MELVDRVIFVATFRPNNFSASVSPYPISTPTNFSHMVILLVIKLPCFRHISKAVVDMGQRALLIAIYSRTRYNIFDPPLQFIPSISKAAIKTSSIQYPYTLGKVTVVASQLDVLF